MLFGFRDAGLFVDKSVVEVYANDRQAKFSNMKAWEMMPSNPY